MLQICKKKARWVFKTKAEMVTSGDKLHRGDSVVAVSLEALTRGAILACGLLDLIEQGVGIKVPPSLGAMVRKTHLCGRTDLRVHAQANTIMCACVVGFLCRGHVRVMVHRRERALPSLISPKAVWPSRRLQVGLLATPATLSSRKPGPKAADGTPQFFSPGATRLWWLASENGKAWLPKRFLSPDTAQYVTSGVRGSVRTVVRSSSSAAVCPCRRDALQSTPGPWTAVCCASFV